MAQVLVRDVPDEVLAQLKLRAARRGRSLQAELLALLEREAQPPADWWEAARKLREEISGRLHTPSEVLIREERDRRWR